MIMTYYDAYRGTPHQWMLRCILPDGRQHMLDYTAPELPSEIMFTMMRPEKQRDPRLMWDEHLLGDISIMRARGTQLVGSVYLCVFI